MLDRLSGSREPASSRSIVLDHDLGALIENAFDRVTLLFRAPAFREARRSVENNDLTFGLIVMFFKCRPKKELAAFAIFGRAL